VVAVPMPAVGTSSSDLRERALAGGSLEVLVPGPVVAYIRRHGLYSR
jgi:nicotinic acid mononucleotide adenylyltransferase